MRSATVVSSVVLLLAAVPAHGKPVGIENPDVSTPTSLFFHMLDFQDMPINTQVPHPDFVTSQAYGPTNPTLKCVHPYTGDVTGQGHGTGGMTSQVYHTAYGYSSPSYVEYDRLKADGTPGTHPERGISYDALLDPAYPIVLEWIVAVYNGPGAEADALPTPTPRVVVAATMRAGDAVSLNDRAYDSGPIIAAGRTDPAVLAPHPVPGQSGAFTTTGTPHGQVDFLGVVDGKYLYRFNVVLAQELDRIQRATGYNVRIDMFLDNPHCRQPTDMGKEYVMTSTLVAYSSGEHRPRLDLAVTNPVRVEYLHPQFIGDDLVVHTAVNSVWGNYDVDESSPDGIAVAISGPSAAASLERAAFVQRTVEHYHHQEAVDVTYVWPYKADRAADGVYEVSVQVFNDQRSAQASATALFEVGKGTVIGCGGVQEATHELSEDCVTTASADGLARAESPGLGLLLPLGAMGAAAAILRRLR